MILQFRFSLWNCNFHKVEHTLPPTPWCSPFTPVNVTMDYIFPINWDPPWGWLAHPIKFLPFFFIKKRWLNAESQFFCLLRWDQSSRTAACESNLAFSAARTSKTGPPCFDDYAISLPLLISQYWLKMQERYGYISFFSRRVCQCRQIQRDCAVFFRNINSALLSIVYWWSTCFWGPCSPQGRFDGKICFAGQLTAICISSPYISFHLKV